MTDAGPLALAWIAQDPDPETRAELETLLARSGEPAADAELTGRFAGRLAFGTAGLRAELGAGPMRMNRVVVCQAAAGIGRWLRARQGRPVVVIGYDGRRNSAVFARDAAEVLAGAGARALLLPRALPTPVLAFAVRWLDAAAGIMITASHNPPQDNGMKVYLGGADEGSQIVPPVDAEIADEIAAVAAGSVAELPRSPAIEVVDEAIIDAYVAATAAVASQAFTFATHGSAQARTPGANVNSGALRVAYTAMHGVGLEVLRRAFASAGLAEPLVVPEQAEPDAAFPTLVFPNPEEPGALDLGCAFATAERADLLIASDPDADRLAVAVPDVEHPDGWRRLTGNEIGLLLGWDAASRAAGTGAVLASSLVSSPGLARIAAHFGLTHVETFTGFKWISRVPGLVYGYEEALGYLVNPETVRDKDGISAAVRFVALAQHWRSEGSTVDDALDTVAEEIGADASGQVSIRVTDLAEITRSADRLRSAPPAELAGRAVVATRDYRDDAEQRADILRFDLADGSRVIVRPSGTEPKLKIYLDTHAFDGTGRARRRAAAAAVAELEQSVRSLLA